MNEEIEGIIPFTPMETAIVRIGGPEDLDKFMPSLTRCMADFKGRTGTDQDMAAVYMAIRAGLSTTGGTEVWLAVRESHEVVGYLMAHTTNVGLEGGKECFVWQAYCMAGDVFSLGWEYLVEWALVEGCARITFMTNRDEDTMARRLRQLGFIKKSTLFEVKLNG